MAKSYKSFTGLTGFYYKTEGGEIKKAERIKFLQEISVSKEQSIEKAYGDNGVAEMAVTNGTVELESTFHHLPLEDRINLFGLEQDEDGIVAVGNDTPPYTAVIFEKTTENGPTEYVGLKKGLFTFPEVSGQTKEDSVEFSQDQSTAEFMETEIEGFKEPKTMLLAKDEKGSTKGRDMLWQKIFGETFEGGSEEEGNTP
ncbi:phage tail protein [Mammaliicoccus sciuri]|uniref:Phage tail protein n=1 Tax=Mammaliicoccus sciuri TaxID=1296 RepID=A0AAW5LJW6_MAMSC|nr:MULTISPECIES: major tail protein [Mammaliicoccus]KTT86012.1 phage tail protein [Mammaliicoccus sciuri]KTT90337.1 phage tail protein [Mammaliicoccus sciuri]KTT91077.1 phage tail protein [Mammaliicoccus sciuri]KTT93888.1 phage tail protein [Mammaliicoccus sciuri]KTW14100.1 phage tail protein [Mammaliicoccus sciuri]